MSFDVALEEGKLEEAQSLLDDLARAPDTGGLWLPECYADLAKAFDRCGQHDDAIAALETAIEHEWSSILAARSDIAEFHLRAGRGDEAARIWAELTAEEPEDVWLLPRGRVTEPTMLYRLRDGVYARDLLIVAIAELDVFTRLAQQGPIAFEGLCEQLQLDARAADVMVTYLVALGLLERTQDGRIRVTRTAEDHLVAGSRYDLRAYFGSLGERPGCVHRAVLASPELPLRSPTRQAAGSSITTHTSTLTRPAHCPSPSTPCCSCTQRPESAGRSQSSDSFCSRQASSMWRADRRPQTAPLCLRASPTDRYHRRTRGRPPGWLICGGHGGPRSGLRRTCLRRAAVIGHGGVPEPRWSGTSELRRSRESVVPSRPSDLVGRYEPLCFLLRQSGRRGSGAGAAMGRPGSTRGGITHPRAGTRMLVASRREAPDLTRRLPPTNDRRAKPQRGAAGGEGRLMYNTSVHHGS